MLSAQSFLFYLQMLQTQNRMYSPILLLTLLLLKNGISASIQPVNKLQRQSIPDIDYFNGMGVGVNTTPILTVAATNSPPNQPTSDPLSECTEKPPGGQGVGCTGTSVGAGNGSGLPPGSALIIQRGINCGYVQLNPNDTVQITSRNYNVSNYFNNEDCTWKFEGNRCTLSTICPCVDFPSSPFCLEDYLRITDKYNFDQRYCGGNSPGTVLISDSDTLTIRYRTNRRITATGFVCYVSCTPPNLAPLRSIAEGTPCPAPTITRVG